MEEDKGPPPFILYHASDHHAGFLGLGDGVGDYKLEVEGVYRDLMTRQVGEDARMSLCDKNVELINSKNEYDKTKSDRTI